MAESGAQLASGTVIGGTYEVMHQIGRGGMGEVWVARHLRIPKQVAIKVLTLRGAPLTEDALARFYREAQIASRLAHPNIVEVHDHNTLPSGDPYLVLELLEGEPLSRRLKRGPMSLEDARSVVRQVGSALQAAHAQGVVHRDLKPDNIFLLPSPLGGLRVKVLDFGISKIQDSTTVLTQEAVLVGTPQYMSPEQATGSNKDVGPQSDVFALAAITYEMLSGQASFKGESIAQLVFRVAYEKHEPLAPLVAPDMAPTAVAAVEHGLLKDRAHRTGDIATFVKEFTGESITLAPSASVPPAPQMAVVATPSMVMSASIGVADTAAPSGSQPSIPVPAPVVPESKAVTPPVPTQPATPHLSPPTRLPSIPPGANAAPAPPVAPVSTTSSTAPRGFNFKMVWVTAASLAAMGLGFVAINPGPAPDRLAADEGGAPARKAMFGGAVKEFAEAPVVAQADPRAVPTPPVEAQPATPEPPKPATPKPAHEHESKPAPAEAAKPATPEPAHVDPLPAPSDPPPPPPPSERVKKKGHRQLTPEEKARVEDMRAAAITEGRAKVDMRILVQRHNQLAEGVTNQFALDEMASVVAMAMCKQGDERWFIWRDRIQTPALKEHVEERCAK